MKSITLLRNSYVEIDGGYIVIGDYITTTKAEVYEFVDQDGGSEFKNNYIATKKQIEKLISKYKGESVKVILDTSEQN